MAKYIILPLFIVSLLISFYFIYAKMINDKLIKRKQYMGLSSEKNKYRSNMHMASSVCVLIGGLLIFSFVYQAPSKNILTGFNNISEYEESFSNIRLLSAQSSNNESKLETNFALELDGNLYCLNNNYIIKYDLDKETNKVYLFDETYQNLYLYNSNEKIIVYGEGKSENNIIIFDTNLKVKEVIILNQKANSIVINNEEINIYSVINAKENYFISLKTKNILESLKYNEIFYNPFVNYSKENLFVHLKINLKSYSISKSAILLNDVFYEIKDNIVYVATNLKESFLKTSCLHIYNQDEMITRDYKVIPGEVKGFIKDKDIEIVLYNKQLKQYLINENIELVESNYEINNDNLNAFKLEARLLLNSFTEPTVIDYDNYNIMKHVIFSDGVRELFIKIDESNNRVYHVVEKEYNLYYTNKYLITGNIEGIIDIQVINNIGK